jgi:hypothetical protein
MTATWRGSHDHFDDPFDDQRSTMTIAIPITNYRFKPFQTKPNSCFVSRTWSERVADRDDLSHGNDKCPSSKSEKEETANGLSFGRSRCHYLHRLVETPHLDQNCQSTSSRPSLSSRDTRGFTCRGSIIIIIIIIWKVLSR